ncbi:MAG: hydroxymethylglutaryl-CoA synthase [Candidatus Anstonellales archaeon]
MADIVSYGAYIPKYRIQTREIAEVWGEDPARIEDGLGIKEKAVPAFDEDAATMAVEAARVAIRRGRINPKDIGAVYVGSESHPYAVKPTATIVAEAIDATPSLTAADLEFACKAGTAGVQIGIGMVDSGLMKYALAIGSDTAQGRPADALEYSAAAGAGAIVVGKSGIAHIEMTYSFSTDTPDFWRRQGAEFPSHGGRFTGEPAYFKHIIGATKGILEKGGYSLNEFDYVVFHQPNAKFPTQAAKKLGIPKEKLMPGLLVPRIGNTYSGATMLGLCAVLDVAKPGQKILATSFGSGAGSDSFVIEVKEGIEELQKVGPSVEEMIADKEYVTYARYVKLRRKLKGLVE